MVAAFEVFAAFELALVAVFPFLTLALGIEGFLVVLVVVLNFVEVAFVFGEGLGHDVEVPGVEAGGDELADEPVGLGDGHFLVLAPDAGTAAGVGLRVVVLALVDDDEAQRGELTRWVAAEFLLPRGAEGVEGIELGRDDGFGFDDDLVEAGQLGEGGPIGDLAGVKMHGGEISAVAHEGDGAQRAVVGDLGGEAGELGSWSRISAAHGSTSPLL